MFKTGFCLRPLYRYSAKRYFFHFIDTSATFNGGKCRDACLAEQECACFDYDIKNSRCSLKDKFTKVYDSDSHDCGCNGQYFPDRSMDGGDLTTPAAQRMVKTSSSTRCKELCLIDKEYVKHLILYNMNHRIITINPVLVAFAGHATLSRNGVT